MAHAARSVNLESTPRIVGKAAIRSDPNWAAETGKFSESRAVGHFEILGWRFRLVNERAACPSMHVARVLEFRHGPHARRQSG